MWTVEFADMDRQRLRVQLSSATTPAARIYVKDHAGADAGHLHLNLNQNRMLRAALEEAEDILLEG